MNSDKSLYNSLAWYWLSVMTIILSGLLSKALAMINDFIVPCIPVKSVRDVLLRLRYQLVSNWLVSNKSVSLIR